MKNIKITTYKNENKVKVEYHANYQPYKYKSKIKNCTMSKIKNIEYPFMTLAQYIKTLNRKRIELNDLFLKEENCISLTLTSQNCCT